MKSNIKGKVPQPMKEGNGEKGIENRASRRGFSIPITKMIRDTFNGTVKKFGKSESFMIIYTMLNGKLLKDMKNPHEQSLAKKEIIKISSELVDLSLKEIKSPDYEGKTKNPSDIDKDLICLASIENHMPEEKREPIIELKKEYGIILDELYVDAVESYTNGFKFLAQDPVIYYANVGNTKTRKFDKTSECLWTRFNKIRNQICNIMEENNISEEKAIAQLLSDENAEISNPDRNILKKRKAVIENEKEICR